MQLLVAAPLTRAADTPTPASASAKKTTPPPAYIELDGRRVLEIRVAAGAQTPAQLARVASQRLAELAANYSIEPEQIVLQEDPPYTTIGVMRGEMFEPRLSVDDRNAARFHSHPLLGVNVRHTCFTDCDCNAPPHWTWAAIL